MNNQEILDNAPEGNYTSVSMLNGKPEVWGCNNFHSLADIQTIVDLRRENAELEKELLDIVNNSVEVIADARNTPAVRKQFELGGYVKHYIVPRHTILNAKALKEQGNE